MREVARYISITLLLLGAYLLTRVPDIGSDLVQFSAGFLLMSLGYLGLINFGLPAGRFKWWFWFVMLVVIVRILALNMLPSDDIARYIWEGQMVREGISPYALSPDDPELEIYRDDTIYPMINHKDMPAIYPPLTHLVFACLTFLTTTIQGFRLFILFVEMMSILMMYLWIMNRSINRNRILIYALNPLVVIGIAGQGHLDSLQILFLISGFYAWQKKQHGWALALITFSGLIKVLGFFVLPFMFERKTLWKFSIPVIIIIFSFIPFIFLKGGLSIGNWGVYLGRFEYYSLTFAPLRLIFGTIGAHIITALVLITSLYWLWLTRTRPENAAAPFLMLVTLMSTTVHFWYLTPLLALAVVWRMRALIGLSILFLPYFFVYGRFVQTGEWIGVWWWQVLTYTIFAILFMIELKGIWISLSKNKPDLGVVIPVLNDAGNLKKLLSDLEANDINRDDVIVVDGGSTDESAEVAANWGAQVIRSEQKGRGSQIASGVSQLESELVLVLHADNRIPSHTVDKIRRTAVAYWDAPGGACRIEYDDKGLKSLIRRLLSNSKTSLYGLSFGDQGQWFRRNVVQVPEMPLMEDVELAIRMNDRGRTVWTLVTLKVSVRRYKNLGSVYVLRTTISRCLKYMFQRRWNGKVPDTTEMYNEYYKCESVKV